MGSKEQDELDEAVVGNHISPQVSIVRRDENDNASISPSLHQVESADVPDFKPTRKLYIAFSTLSVITLMVAMDGTSLSVALPVRLLR